MGDEITDRRREAEREGACCETGVEAPDDDAMLRELCKGARQGAEIEDGSERVEKCRDIVEASQLASTSRRFFQGTRWSLYSS